MRYRCIEKFAWDWADTDENKRPVLAEEKVAILITNRDLDKLSKIGFKSEVSHPASDETLMRLSIRKGVKSYIINGAQYKPYSDSDGINICIVFLESNILQLSICEKDNPKCSLCIPLYKEKPFISRTTAIILSFKDGTDVLEITYHAVRDDRILVQINGDHSVFDIDDVFEVNIHDRFDEMRIYDPNTEKELPKVQVTAHWFNELI